MQADVEVMAMLDEAAVTYQIILTKTDKLKKGQLEKTLEASQLKIAKRPAAHPDVLVTSAEKKSGLDVLRAEIVSLALPETGL